MSESEPLRGVVVAHGTLAAGLTDAVRKISGVGDEVLVPVSNEGRSPQALQAEIEALLKDQAMIIFTDLVSGSCAMAAKKCVSAPCSPVVVTGVNLPVLLDFVFNRHLPMEELIPRLLSRGATSIKSTPEFSENVDPTVSG